MHVRYPIWLRTIERPGSQTFAIMFALESTARALLSTVIAIQALALLHDARNVSLVFSLIGVSGFAASFLVPVLIGRISRRYTYTLGSILLLAAAGLLASLTVPGQIFGMIIRVFATACLSITTSLYIMQYISKRDLTRAEPRRMQYSALAWTIGPWLGVKIYETLGPDWSYGASAVAALIALGFFWMMRLRDNPVIQPANRPPPNPIKSIGRFLQQPRLRLAWIITFGRSAWWVFFFVYTPLYMIESGFSREQGALAVSAGNALLFLTPLFGELGSRFGIRKVLTGGFVLAGVATLFAGLSYHNPYLSLGFLMLAATGCVALDALGTIPFFRAVHPYERAQMTTVFRTYIDIAELLTPGLFAILLTVSDLQTVFIVFGGIVASFAIWPKFLPRRM